MSFLGSVISPLLLLDYTDFYNLFQALHGSIRIYGYLCYLRDNYKLCQLYITTDNLTEYYNACPFVLTLYNHIPKMNDLLVQV